ncbi:unnamed protein product [Ectocarpus sp. 12 AP-2014]
MVNPHLHKNPEGCNSRNKLSIPPTVHPRGLMWKQPMSNLATQITHRLSKAFHCTTVVAFGSALTAKLLIQKPCQPPLATRISKLCLGGLRQMSTRQRGTQSKTTRISSICLPTPTDVSRVCTPGSRHIGK